MFFLSETPIPQNQVNDRVFFIDVIRASAIIMVVLGHTTACFLLSFSDLHIGWWWLGTLLFSLAHASVPMFFMISGMLLLNPEKNDSLTDFFQKRFIKVFIPFLFWTFVYLIWRVYFHGEILSFKQTLRDIIVGPMYVHLWFLYVILALYLVTPILRVYVRNASISNLVYFVAIWFIIIAACPAFRTGTFGFVGYFVLGYLFRYVNLSKKYTSFVLVIAIGVTIFTAFGTYVLTLRAGGEYNGYFFDTLRPNIIILSACMFWLLKTLPCNRILIKVPSCRNVISLLSSASFGIYLIHMIFLEVLESGRLGVKLTAMSIHPLVGIPATLFVVTALSLLVVSLFWSIPYLRGVVPQKPKKYEGKIITQIEPTIPQVAHVTV